MINKTPEEIGIEITPKEKAMKYLIKKGNYQKANSDYNVEVGNAISLALKAKDEETDKKIKELEEQRQMLLKKLGCPKDLWIVTLKKDKAFKGER